ncbi:hypothetical protein Goshw_011109 [Gossypium schwendimanii]|uniref:Uncharacterized protein n=1 Tax=Gossypium schwendimanii TaxID=34291 RepID=A0A7J9N624_GOSSC|nr:hypothetical protein [Gossypium schwendimanii]
METLHYSETNPSGDSRFA